MTVQPIEWTIESKAWRGVHSPVLSVLIPFFRDDPVRLLTALDGATAVLTQTANYYAPTTVQEATMMCMTAGGTFVAD